jgi:mono/diheme cytochrome c family protein
MRMTPTVIIVGILALLTAITLTVVYWPYATRDLTPSDIFRQRTEVEAAGRKIYLKNGCVYCHSQSIRGIDWGHGADRIWHIAHFINPRYTRPSSIMPPFEWLGMERVNTLTQYVQSLGLKDADRRMQRQRFWKAESIKAYEGGPVANAKWLLDIVPEGWREIPNPYPTTHAGLQRGQKIYQNFCIGCHGPVGDGMGPAQPWIYPPPLNFTILKDRGISGGILIWNRKRSGRSVITWRFTSSTKAMPTPNPAALTRRGNPNRVARRGMRGKRA